MSSPEVLFSEPGARWRAVAYGPAFCLAILLLEILTDSPVHWFALIFCAVLIAAFVALQVFAARRHVSLALTETELRSGTEVVPLREIAEILPPRAEPKFEEDWESARALGELSGVPRRRTGIGLRLRNGTVVQAWAKDHRGLRAALTAALPAEENGADR
ncbi:hypothetical protein ACFVMC_23730 [Nocardia sp. NPDC127579]|uniref:hypothetical protein n=1 Tax=Nocardia sp. NPDC127579 TaxID=3345402 RepID=UPI00363206DD